MKVFVRSRPTATFAQELIEILPDGKTVQIHQSKGRRCGGYHAPSSWCFQLDGVLHLLSQEEVYARVGQEVVLGALDGYNGTVLCFGQTGAGKTYTMTGTTESYRQRGIIPRAVEQVFQEVAKRSDQIFSVQLSYLEVYNDTLTDLLSTLAGPQHLAPRGPVPPRPGLALMEEPGGRVSIRGLSLHPVQSKEEALDLLFEGELNRIMGAHAMNNHSSRSHCIFTLHIQSRSRSLSGTTFLRSKLSLVDLAGSERLGRTGGAGQTLREATHINKSLSFLEQTILALADPRRDHVPFRQSKLTHALKHSLGGNCNTVLVANIYGEETQMDETLSTLRFASRMKSVKSQPSINQHVDPALEVKRLQKEVEMLRDELSIQNLLVNGGGARYQPLSKAQQAELQDQVQRYLEGSLEAISVVSVRQLQEVFSQFRLAVQEQEQRVKAKLSQTYTLVERGRADDSANPKEEDEVEEEEEEEEEEEVGGSRRVGGMTGRARVKSKRKKAKEAPPSRGKKPGAASPVHGKALETRSSPRIHPPPQTPEDEPDPPDQEVQEAPPPEAEPIRTDSPPTKAQAFEEFKASGGAGLHRLLRSNKEVLQERRALLHLLGQELNAAKRDIDAAAEDVQRHRHAHGRLRGSEETQDVEEALVGRLGALRTRYRQHHDQLGPARAEVRYCQHLVDRCRVRLLSEFESWYPNSLLSPREVPERGSITPGLVPPDRSPSLGDEERRPCEHVQSRRGEGPGAVAFYNAHRRSLRRMKSRRPPGTLPNTLPTTVLPFA
ncbi:kinesin-like protein KIF9 [Gadus macrocephalus]|uniref:kinesin-like protein KIF9 n=1 Tax=Gadus macrocephalus TaxID=80720 RepID=UPI0028CB71E2|nr:kinesin-like protein KIF9 [Gadus macrocephalus]